MLLPLYCNFPTYLFDPQTFVRNPVLWLQYITKYEATFSTGPNFAYELCANKWNGEELNLDKWRVALNGAEPVRASTIDKFCARFEQFGFRRNGKNI